MSSSFPDQRKGKRKQGKRRDVNGAATFIPWTPHTIKFPTRIPWASFRRAYYRGGGDCWKEFCVSKMLWFLDFKKEKS